MTGYEIYTLCKKLQCRKIPNFDTFKTSQECTYYLRLAEWFIQKKNFSSNDVKDYLKVIKNICENEFDPYTIMTDEIKWDEQYIIWKKLDLQKKYIMRQLDLVLFI